MVCGLDKWGGMLYEKRLSEFLLNGSEQYMNSDIIRMHSILSRLFFVNRSVMNEPMDLFVIIEMN